MHPAVVPELERPSAGDAPDRCVLIVGGAGGTQVGKSLAVAVEGWTPHLLDTAAASAGPKALRALAWRLGRRVPRLASFGRSVVETVRATGADTVVTTGAAPVRADDLARVHRMGVRLVNYSTDDPWNPGSRAGWFLRALPHYDAVFTPRTANVEDFRRLGVREVRYLPFGYDPRHCIGPEPGERERERLACDVLFVGGADGDRAPVLRALVEAGLDVALYGGYWDRYAGLRAAYRGHVSPETLRRATLAARIALVLPRRANRDGHTMRSVEAGAIGACLLAEDTPDHRALYGGEAVYFRSIPEMVERARELLQSPDERRMMAVAVRDRIRRGGHTYADRLRVMLEAAR
jgi:hypothetical protein